MNIFLHSLVAALAPLIIGFIWYNPKVFGTAWMNSIGKTPEQLREGSNFAKMMILTYVFSLLVALFMNGMVVHQYGIFSLLANNPESQLPGANIELMLNGQSIAWKDSFRTFGHGAFHGTLAGIFLAIPIVGLNAIYERRGAKYIFINAGYWTVSMAIMGGIICGWV